MIGLIQTVARAWALSNAELAALLALEGVAGGGGGGEMLTPALLGGFAPNTDRADRLRIMYSIHGVLADLFVNPADEARWLRERLPLLGNLSPLEYMLENRIPGMVRIQEITRRMANR